MKKINLCVFCGELKPLYQNNLCSECLRQNMQRGSTTINDIRPFIPKTNRIEIKNFPDGAA
ncbi:hypothetical protein LEP1GSC125_1863 [Leptospira mayottensis 200901122]|uniref:Uncharacterized protein n=2 Tax=Leptospira mayottensis TaxID=1137606 RepID=A0AA87SVW3_9LEPT|nr:hypothetical protein DQM28_10175 [Leptospira mayottensis]EKR98472.1 hypothetical protein LEP1GSC125_1863 [Leptospira mayottensis 200901122]